MQLCAGLEINSALDLSCCLVEFLCLLSSHQSYFSGNIFGPFWNHSAGNSFRLSHWYNPGVSADYINNPHLSYNQFDRLHENTAVAQTFLCLHFCGCNRLLFAELVHSRGLRRHWAGYQEEKRYRHTPSSFHNMMLTRTWISAGHTYSSKRS